MHYQSLLTLFLFTICLPVKLSASIHTRTLEQVLSSFYEEVNCIDKLEKKEISVFKPAGVDLNSNLPETTQKWISQYSQRFKQEKVDEIVKKTAQTNQDIQTSYDSIQSINWDQKTQTYQSLLTNLRKWVTFYTTYKDEFLATVRAESQKPVASKTPVTTPFDRTIKNSILEKKDNTENDNSQNKQEPRFKITPMHIVLMSFFCLFVLSIVSCYRKWIFL